MSVDFTILCTESPARFLQKRPKSLEWGARDKSGSFGGMSLWWRPLDKNDPLPAPEWAERVVAVLHSSGRLKDETYDDYDRWITRLARKTHGAVYNHRFHRFDFVSADFEQRQTRARAKALLAAGDFGALVRWVDELHAKHAATKHSSRAAWRQLRWIAELAGPVLEQRIAAGDASAAPAIVALHRVLAKSRKMERLDALVIAAAGLPALAEDRALQAIAWVLAAEKMRFQARVMPADLEELNLLLDGVEREDPLSLQRLENFIVEVRNHGMRCHELVVALAASGRALPEPLMKRLAELMYYVEALQSEAARAEFAKHGTLARRIADRILRNEVERKLAAPRIAQEATPRIAQARAENDAYYGPARKRPRLPDDIVVFIRRRQFEVAIATYRKRFPDIADQAEQAIEDARAYFVPSEPAARREP